MLREKKSDPYANIRRDVPPPGKVIRSLKQYDRKTEKEDILREVEEFREELERDNVNLCF